MMGSEALFFSIQPERAILGDINGELINFYRIIKRTPKAFYREISRLPASKAHYYELRKTYPSSPIARALRFFYLVRLSWNGLYRVNRRGRFNVPFGGRTPTTLVSWDGVLFASQALKRAYLWNRDFEETAKDAQSGDLLYFDPPYPKGAVNGNGFTRYSESGFSLEEHRRIARCAAMLADRGVNVLITEAARREIMDLYSASFYATRIRTSSLIAGRSKFRRQTYEVVLTSYKLEARSR
jgi:DNA adenine methylase